MELAGSVWVAVVTMVGDGSGMDPLTYITPKFDTVEVRFDLAKPSQVVGFGEFGKLGSVLSRSDGGCCGNHSQRMKLRGEE